MSIKAVDYQVILPKATEVSTKAFDEDYQKGQAINQQQTNTVQQKAQKSVNQVYTQEKAQEGRIREKQDKNQKDSKYSKKKHNGSNAKNNKLNSDAKSSIIDIRL